MKTSFRRSREGGNPVSFLAGGSKSLDSRLRGNDSVLTKSLLVFLLLLFTVVASAQNIVYRDSAEETRFRALTEQLRCVMCQNQSLADSTAPIAHDLRLEIIRLMREGKSDAQIKQFLVARYTDFVLYEPEMKPMTWLLWFGPGLLVLVGGITIAVIVRKRSREAPRAPPPIDSQEW
jgi:cytochrome c-type biogenesis protein CcmH